jgi:hypothetical protein
MRITTKTTVTPDKPMLRIGADPGSRIGPRVSLSLARGDAKVER